MTFSSLVLRHKMHVTCIKYNVITMYVFLLRAGLETSEGRILPAGLTLETPDMGYALLKCMHYNHEYRYINARIQIWKHFQPTELKSST